MCLCMCVRVCVRVCVGVHVNVFDLYSKGSLNWCLKYVQSCSLYGLR